MVYRRPNALVARAVRERLEQGEKVLRRGASFQISGENRQRSVAIDRERTDERAFLLLQAKSCLDIAQDAHDTRLRGELLSLAADLQAKAALQ